MAYKNQRKNRAHKAHLKLTSGLAQKKHERDVRRERIKHPVRRPLDEAECERLLKQRGLI